MKKILSLALVLVLALSLFACGSKDTAGTVTVVAGEQTLTVDLSRVEGDQGLLSVLDVLVADGLLTYSAPGGFLEQVGSVAQDAGAGKYVFVYTSVAENDDVSAYGMSTEWNGQTLHSVGVGAAELAIRDGGIYYIGLVQW